MLNVSESGQSYTLIRYIRRPPLPPSLSLHTVCRPPPITPACDGHRMFAGYASLAPNLPISPHDLGLADQRSSAGADCLHGGADCGGVEGARHARCLYRHTHEVQHENNSVAASQASTSDAFALARKPQITHNFADLATHGGKHGACHYASVSPSLLLL